MIEVFEIVCIGFNGLLVSFKRAAGVGQPQLNNLSQWVNQPTGKYQVDDDTKGNQNNQYVKGKTLQCIVIEVNAGSGFANFKQVIFLTFGKGKA
ncbi:hypothetical protein D3C73_1138670 [compost metagenome]